MGIKNFTKIFNDFQSIDLSNFKQFNIKTIAIDAYSEIYRALKSPITLYDKKGNYTHHIKILLYNIIKRKINNIEEIWIFDYYDKEDKYDNNYIKCIELEKRNISKQKCKLILEKLKIEKNDIIKKSSLYNISDFDKNHIKLDLLEQKINNKEKSLISITSNIINEFRFILDLLNIPYLISPKYYEAEQIAAYLTNTKIKIVDAVYTNDVDALLFGAQNVILKRNNPNEKNKLIFYNLSNLLNNYNISQDELIKIGIIIGCDFCEKTPHIGYKTIFKKYNTIKLNFNQLLAFKFFKKKINFNDLVWYNVKDKSFNDKKKIKNLIKFLIHDKNFEEDIVNKMFKNFYE